MFRPLSRTKLAFAALGLIAVGLCGWGGHALYQHLTGAPLTPQQARQRIAQYLDRQTGHGEFRADLSRVLSNAPAELVLTNKAGKIKQRKLAAASPEVELSRAFQQHLEMAGDYRTIYRLIGEHLAAAETLLAGTNAAHRHAGLRVAIEALHAAWNDASDAWLAARVIEGYLWPNLDTADLATGSKSKLNSTVLLALADRVFREADEPVTLARNYQLMIGQAPQSARADKARVRLARLREDQGNYREALHYYQEVQNPNNAKLQPRIAALENRLKRP